MTNTTGKNTKPGLNYIQLLNQFWRVKRAYKLTSNESMLYLGLLDKCNSLSWKNPFRESERYLSKELNISPNTLRKDRVKLSECGLISFSLPEKASKSVEGSATYFIIENVSTASTTEAVETPQPLQNSTSTASTNAPQPLQNSTSTASTVEANNKPSTINNNNKPSFLNEKQKNDFVIPSHIVSHQKYSEFMTEWQKLLLTPKWKNRDTNQLQSTLDAFNNYDPAYLIEKISAVIQADWPMVKVSKEDFENWCSANGRLPYVIGQSRHNQNRTSFMDCPRID